MLIEPRVEMEWGVLCGYTEDGHFSNNGYIRDGRFYGRSYFDYLKPDEKDIFTENKYFLADKYPGADPGLTYFLRGRTIPIPLDEALKTSLETAQHLYSAKPRHNGQYVFGLDAYDIFINGLRYDDANFAAITQYGATGNGIIHLTRLIDARRAAHAFWAEKSLCLPSGNAKKMRDVAELYAKFVSTLNAVLPDDFIASTQNGYPFEAWSGETRIQFADALTTCKQLEQQAVDIIADVLNHW